MSALFLLSDRFLLLARFLQPLGLCSFSYHRLVSSSFLSSLVVSSFHGIFPFLIASRGLLVSYCLVKPDRFFASVVASPCLLVSDSLLLHSYLIVPRCLIVSVVRISCDCTVPGLVRCTTLGRNNKKLSLTYVNW